MLLQSSVVENTRYLTFILSRNIINIRLGGSQNPIKLNIIFQHPNLLHPHRVGVFYFPALLCYLLGLVCINERSRLSSEY